MHESAYREWLADQNYQPSSIRKLVNDLKSYLRDPAIAEGQRYVRACDYAWAYDVYDEFCEDTYAPQLGIPRPPKPVREDRRRRGRKKRQKDAVSIEPKQWRRLTDRLKGDASDCGLVLTIMAETGLRVGDVLRVQRDRLQDALEREDGTVYLVVKGRKEAVTTVNAARGAWIGLLNRMRAHRVQNVAAAVVPSKDSNAAPGGAAYAAVRRHFQEHCKAAKVTGQQNLHRIRRTVAIRLREAGVSSDDVQAVLGHADRKTTEIYTDEFKGRIIQKALGRLNG